MLHVLVLVAGAALAHGGGVTSIDVKNYKVKVLTDTFRQRVNLQTAYEIRR